MEELKIAFFFIMFLGLFLLGMQMMSHGLIKLSSHSITKVLHQVTNHPLKSFLFGIIATAILQSSSAVMVIVIGFVTSGLLPFSYTIGIILGTNIGTTVTTEILAFRINDFIPYIMMIGFICMMFRNHKVSSIGCVLFGLGCIFLAMHEFENLSIPLSSIDSVSNLFKACEENMFLALFFSTMMTGIIQSSSAMTGLSMVFSEEMGLALKTSLVFVLGANIGTCVTAFLASIKSNLEGKYTAYAHLLQNIFSVILFMPFMNFWTNISSHLASEISVQIAHFSFLFNTINSLIFLPFCHMYAKFIMWFYHFIKRVSKKDP